MAEFIVTLRVEFTPNADGSLIPPVDWDYGYCLRNYGIPSGKAEILNMSPVRYEDGEEEGMSSTHQERDKRWREAKAGTDG
jgi:hypothetical protein